MLVVSFVVYNLSYYPIILLWYLSSTKKNLIIFLSNPPINHVLFWLDVWHFSGNILVFLWCVNQLSHFWFDSYNFLVFPRTVWWLLETLLASWRAGDRWCATSSLVAN